MEKYSRKKPADMLGVEEESGSDLGSSSTGPIGIEVLFSQLFY